MGHILRHDKNNNNANEEILKINKYGRNRNE